MSKLNAFIFVVILVLFIKDTIKCKRISIDHTFLATRNDYLRLYLLLRTCNNKMRICLVNTAGTIKHQSIKTYNSVLSKYYDYHTAYYSLSPEDRELIEHIINLHF